MDRRTFIATVAGSLFTAPIAAVAQRAPTLKRIGVLHQYAENDPEGRRRYLAFVQALQELGWVEGRNISTEIRYAATQMDRLSALVAELLQANVDVIITSGTVLIEAVHKATTTIPVVMAAVGDPVGTGLVASLAHPGGNLTGLSNQATELSAKRLELASEIVPNLTRVAALWNPDNASLALKLREIEAAARIKGVHVEVLAVRRPADFDEAFQLATRARVNALILAEDSLLVSQRSRIIDFAMGNRLPVISEFRLFADAGGLLSYGPDQIDMWRRAATFVDKILKGAKPADLPIEQPAKLELVINLKTAKALGLTIPQSLLLRADEVIQ